VRVPHQQLEIKEVSGDQEGGLQCPAPGLDDDLLQKFSRARLEKKRKDYTNKVTPVCVN